MLNLLAGFFAVNSAAILLTLYYWLRISDFYLYPIQEKSVNSESSCAKLITTFSAIFHESIPHEEEVSLLSDEREAELLDNTYNTF